MSTRNTGLFILGSVSDDTVARAFAAWSDYDPAHFAGEEGPRVGRTTWHGQPVTHVALRLFEVAGLRLMSEDALPEASDLEMVLGRSLSALHPVVYAFYEDEQMAGGGARFEGGRLTYRVAVDGQVAIPIRRTLDDTRPIEELDASHWIWPHASRALADAFPTGFTSAPEDDDTIEQLILAAQAAPITLLDAPAPPPPADAPAGPRTRRRDRLKSALKGWMRRE